MLSRQDTRILVEHHRLSSVFLLRDVLLDCYFPSRPAAMTFHPPLLLINDGQNMEELGLKEILDRLYVENNIEPVCCVAVHAGAGRKMEYGIASQADYMGRGAKAGAYTSFILEELLPFLYGAFPYLQHSEKSFAGFSLGGLSALDIVWHHPDVFGCAAVFSGSLWWRSLPQEHAQYDDDRHRIMHQIIRQSEKKAGLKFFLQCGNKDETKDRNQNGIIDSVDDTLDLVKELEQKGYAREKDIFYLELKDGRHDIKTWAGALPVFLKWRYGKDISEIAFAKN